MPGTPTFQISAPTPHAVPDERLAAPPGGSLSREPGRYDARIVCSMHHA